MSWFRPEVEWGLTLCRWRHCVDLAVLVFDGDPYCLAHGEDAWERAVAHELLGERVWELLPPLGER